MIERRHTSKTTERYIFMPKKKAMLLQNENLHLDYVHTFFPDDGGDGDVGGIHKVCLFILELVSERKRVDVCVCANCLLSFANLSTCLSPSIGTPICAYHISVRIYYSR